MKRNWLLVSALSVLSAACASSSRAPQAVSVPVPAELEAEAVRDAAELRRELEEAYEKIAARSSRAIAPVHADAEAALSMEIPEHRTIHGAVKYFSTDLHEKIQRSLDRSVRYKPLIDGILDEHRLPRALAYLPVIESAYSPTLTSRAGARGMWQFMPPTAGEYNLKIDWWVDERANVEKSTRAAARYLQDLHRMFNDWPLALAAYNAGPGRIRRALNSSGSTTFWELNEKAAIPRETRGYVPTFYATLLIASDPAAYGFTLKESEDVSPPAPARVTGPVSLAYLADVAETDLQTLKALNPELTRELVPPGVQTVYVPESAAERIARHAATLRYEDPHMPVASFTLRNGDSLKTLSRILGVSQQDLLKMNGLSRDRLRPGDSLYLPVKQTELSSILQRKHSAPVDTYYTVQKGDTLYSIARRHGLTVEELSDLNRLRGATIHPGDRLRVSLGTTLTSGGM